MRETSVFRTSARDTEADIRWTGRTAGGTAIASVGSVEDGAKIIKDAIDAFGTVHILVNK